jgi:hypothetical protein
MKNAHCHKLKERLYQMEAEWANRRKETTSSALFIEALSSSLILHDAFSVPLLGLVPGVVHDAAHPLHFLLFLLFIITKSFSALYKENVTAQTSCS